MAEFTTYSDGRFTSTLGFALQLRDAVTGLAPLGRLRTKLDGVPVEAPRNRSGYWLFLNLPLSLLDGTAAGYRLEVESDFYFPLVRADIRPRELDRRSPVVAADLLPLPAYPFTAGDTILRGMVQDLTGQPLAGATVDIEHSTVQGTTTASGEFVLSFRQLTPDDVELTGGRRLLVVDNSSDLGLRVQRAGFLSRTLVVQVEEGRENGTTGPIQLSPV